MRFPFLHTSQNNKLEDFVLYTPLTKKKKKKKKNLINEILKLYFRNNQADKYCITARSWC